MKYFLNKNKMNSKKKKSFIRHIQHQNAPKEVCQLSLVEDIPCRLAVVALACFAAQLLVHGFDF